MQSYQSRFSSVEMQSATCCLRQSRPLPHSYSALNYYKNKGAVCSRIDDEDGGLRKWHPV